MRLPLPGFAAACLLTVAALSGCSLPGRPRPGPEVPRPESVVAFDTLYGQNCAGCHGTDGQNGGATDLANPEYEALIDDASLREVIASGRKASLMPGFGTRAGGLLVDKQVDAVLHGMRARWSHGPVLAGQDAPPYKAILAGNPQQGAEVYGLACARCHGASAGKPGPAGSILDGSFLALVSPQMLRTTVIAGRPDLGQPDWRNEIPGRPMTDAEVTDVVAWLGSQRPALPGQPYPNTTPAAGKPGEVQPDLIQTRKP